MPNVTACAQSLTRAVIQRLRNYAALAHLSLDQTDPEALLVLARTATLLLVLMASCGSLPCRVEEKARGERETGQRASVRELVRGWCGACFASCFFLLFY